MIPEGRGVAYECENGHVNNEHKGQPKSAGKGQQPACWDCGGRLERTLVPLRECHDCGNVWAYVGENDRPTCPDCRGKRTSTVSDE